MINSEVSAQETIQSSEEIAVLVAEQAPRFPGCEFSVSDEEKEICASRKQLEYVYRNLKYPTEARKKSISGQVIAQFIINKDGSMSDIEIVKHVEGGCSEAVLQVLGKMAKEITWEPAKNNGQPVKFKYTLPVKFSFPK